MNKRNILFAGLAALVVCVGCDDSIRNDSDHKTSAQQEQIAQQGQAAVPLPTIKNFTRKRTLTLVQEKMDDPTYKTYTYFQNRSNGHLVFFGHTLGYAIAGGTQLTSPSKLIWSNQHGYISVPQADPDLLFSPAQSNGTYIMMQNPKTKEYQPIQCEPDVVTMPFPAPSGIVDGPNPSAD